MSALRRQRVRRWLALLTVLAVFAVGCSSATPTATPIDAVEPTVAASAATDVATAESVDLPTPAPSVTPSATPATPTPTTVPTATPAPTTEPTATPTPTPEPTATPAPVDSPLAEALDASRLESVVCPPDVAAAQVTCAIATVPLDAARPATGETVTIMTALVDNGDPNGVGPVVFLQGGPGIGSVTSAKLFVGGNHDVLFVDPRGTGYSLPKLNCPEVDALWVGQFSNDPAQRIDNVDTARLEAYQQCGARLQAQGVLFDAFNTSSTATDFELLRQLFGYDTWSLWGISYGTRLGLTLMRDYPTGIRAAVLDSVVPFEVDFFATLPENAFRSMAALGQACDIVQCAENHGDFLENLAALTLKLEQEPVVVSATRPVSGATFPFVVGGAEVIDMVFIQLYSTRALRALPRQVGRAEFGGLEELVASYVARRDPERVDLSVAMYYATWCREEFPFFDPSVDDGFLSTTQPDFGDAFAQTLSSDGLQQICDIFSVAPAEPIDDQPLASDIPTIVFAGAFDPITPPQWSRQVADALTNATFVQLADHGHGMSSQCPASIRLAFLIAPDTPPNLECAQTTPPPNFE